LTNFLIFSASNKLKISRIM